MPDLFAGLAGKRAMCGWGGTQRALVGRTGIKTDYSKAAQWSHSLSSEYGCCLWKLAGLYWLEIVSAGLYWFGLISFVLGNLTVKWLNLFCLRTWFPRVDAKVVISTLVVFEVLLMGIF